MLRRPDAAIIGGSMAGLAAGLALRRAGLAVEIFERSPREMQERGAGVVIQSRVLEFMRAYCAAEPAALGVPSYARQLLERSGAVSWSEPNPDGPQLMTSWGTLYRHLRRAFPDAHYHNDHKLSALQIGATRAQALFENGARSTTEMLVLADGANSTARRLLMPALEPQYAGYVAWRGLVAESRLAPSLVAALAEKFTFFHAPHTQMLVYFVPGAEDGVAPGERRANWVWYCNLAAGAPLLELMTDRDGVLRDFSVPQGEVRPELVAAQSALAHRSLPPLLAELFDATPEPFVQPIHDLESPRMAFGCAVLLGDAAFTPRPHPAAATAKAFADAMELAGALSACDYDVVPALARYESAQMKLGSELVAQGRELGYRSQFAPDKLGPEVIRLVARPVKS